MYRNNTLSYNLFLFYKASGIIMQTMSYTALRNNLSEAINKVNDDHTPILITRQNGKPAVLMSLEDFHAYDDTAYLMASPANKKALDEAIARVKAGKFSAHDLIEDWYAVFWWFSMGTIFILAG